MSPLFPWLVVRMNTLKSSQRLMKVQKLRSRKKNTEKRQGQLPLNEWCGLIKKEWGRKKDLRWEMYKVNYLMHLQACLKLMSVCRLLCGTGCTPRSKLGRKKSFSKNLVIIKKFLCLPKCLCLLRPLLCFIPAVKWWTL